MTDAAPAVPIWTCEFKAKPDSVPLEELTVGARFLVSCQGEIPVQWAEADANGRAASLNVVFSKPEESYTLAILKANKLEPQSAELEVTAYKAGEHKPDYFRVVQGEHGFEVTKPQWTVKSVLKPNEQPKPFPPFGPWGLSIPLWFWIALAAAVLMVGFVIWRLIRRQQQKARMKAELAKHRTNMSPAHQFFRDARQLRRRIHGAKQVEDLKQITADLNREFRLYVLREFQIPTLDWSDGAIVSDLKRRHRRVYLKAGDELRKTLRELGRLAKQGSVLLQDVEQMHRASLDAVEKLDAARGGRS